MAEQAVQVVLMTAPSADVAEHVVRTLVDERLAACGNIVPGMTSIYRWQGAVRTDAEVLVILKTTAERAAALLARASALHPYDVPELLVLPVAAGHEPYLAWVRSCSVAGAGT
jgi:periplasmic divalent cation tolerance protein